MTPATQATLARLDEIEARNNAQGYLAAKDIPALVAALRELTEFDDEAVATDMKAAEAHLRKHWLIGGDDASV